MRDTEVLQRASELMRKQARRATTGPWGMKLLRHAERLHESDYMEVIGDVSSDGRSYSIVAKIEDYEDGDEQEANAHHIATWHPRVAVAVADWLTWCIWDATGLSDHGGFDDVESAIARVHPHALAVARAYLGETDDA